MLRRTAGAFFTRKKFLDIQAAGAELVCLVGRTQGAAFITGGPEVG